MNEMMSWLLPVFVVIISSAFVLQWWLKYLDQSRSRLRTQTKKNIVKKSSITMSAQHGSASDEQQEMLENAKELARAEPEKVAGMLREWMQDKD